MPRRVYSKKLMRNSIIAICIVLVCVLFYHSDTSLSLGENLRNTFSGQSAPSGDFKPDNAGKFLFYAMDTGNSDSLLMVAPGGESMLVDAADSDDYPAIESTLKKYGVHEIKALVATHFDSDHIGSMDEVIENTTVDTVYLSNYKDNTKDYRNLMDAIATKNLTPVYALSGMQFNVGDAAVKILNPQDKKAEDPNDASIVLMVSYGSSDFLLTGDMGEGAINDLLQKWGDSIDCEVLKVAHHGSRTGTSDDLLRAATPEIAVIPCGAGNPYGHPHAETLNLLQKNNVQIYRTDRDGDVAVLTDGNTIETYVRNNIPSLPLLFINQTSLPLN